MMTLDKAIHRVYDDLNQIPFRDFQSVGVDEHYYLWYYAESGLYIIKDVMIDCLYLIEARSPVKALKKVKDRLEEAMKAGSYYQEEYE